MIRMRLWKPGNVLCERVDVSTAAEAAAYLLLDEQHQVAILRVETDEDLLAFEDDMIAALAKATRAAKLAVGTHAFVYWNRDTVTAEGDGWRVILRRQIGSTAPPDARRGRG